MNDAGPFAVDWSYLASIRDAAVLDNGTPYLLLPEVRSVIGGITVRRKRLALECMWQTGAHVSEVQRLEVADFSFCSGAYGLSFSRTSDRQILRKGDRERMVGRTVPLTETVFIEELRDYIDDHGYFGTDKLFDVTRQTLNRWIIDRVAEMRKMDEFCLPDFTINPNTFRHSFAANAMIHCASLEQLQSLLGHRFQRSTLRYLSLFGSDTRELIRRMQFR